MPEGRADEATRNVADWLKCDFMQDHVGEVFSLVKGSYSTAVSCEPGTPAAWTAVAVPSGSAPFIKGDAEVAARASATDPNYGGTVTVDRTVAVSLDKA
ncbi:hypothetical protein ACFW9F_22185, partial [Streptomyces sp. NPDC059506]